MRSSASDQKNGEPATTGWIAEHTSCTKPGRVSEADRAPPPGVEAASSTRTDRPGRASVIAAASPFGHDPMTIASLSVTVSLIRRRPWYALPGPPVRPFAANPKPEGRLPSSRRFLTAMRHV